MGLGAGAVAAAGEAAQVQARVIPAPGVVQQLDKAAGKVQGEDHARPH
jgi:Cu/Ag efflux protein CusF